MSIFSAKPYIFASVAVLTLAASSIATSLKQAPAATTESSPWFDTNSNAAASRANPTEKVLSPTTATKIKYLRSVASPLIAPKANCPGDVLAPVLVGGYLYVMTNAELSKYNPATGALIWRSIPDPGFNNFYESLAVSGNLVIVGARGCQSSSDPGGALYAFNTSTGALVWSKFLTAINDAVVAGSYVITEGVNAAGSDVTVLNLNNGNVVWNQFGCGGGYPSVVVEMTVMSNGCDAQSNASLNANSLATGAVLWSLPGSWSIQRGDQSGPNGKHLYATDPTGTVVDLNPLTGQVEYSLSQAVGVLAVDASRVYATCGSQGQDLCGYNIGTGALEWQDTPIATPGLAAEADGVLYLDYGSALNSATGKRITTIWSSFSTRATALAIGDGRIAVVSDPRVLDLFGLPGY